MFSVESALGNRKQEGQEENLGQKKPGDHLTESCSILSFALT
jgi:hypothetical protein